MGAVVRRSFKSASRRAASERMSGAFRQAPQHAYQQGGRAPIPGNGPGPRERPCECLPHPSRRRAERRLFPSGTHQIASAITWARRTFATGLLLLAASIILWRHLLVAALAQRQHRGSRARGSLSSKAPRQGFPRFWVGDPRQLACGEGAEHAISCAIPESSQLGDRGGGRESCRDPWMAAGLLLEAAVLFSVGAAGSRLQREAAPARVWLSGSTKSRSAPPSLCRTRNSCQGVQRGPGQGRLAPAAVSRRPGAPGRTSLTQRHPAKPDEPRGCASNARRGPGAQPIRLAALSSASRPAMADTGALAGRARSAIRIFSSSGVRRG